MFDKKRKVIYKITVVAVAAVILLMK